VERRPLAVAITGGIAAGKSEALASFARHGSAVASSDEVVHRVYAQDETLKAELRARWGDDVFGSDGEVDRAAIGRIVFADRGELDWLEQQVHPRVRAVNRAWLEELAARHEPPALAVVEVPLLYETGAEAGFDRVVAITAPAELRERRRVGVDDRAARLVPDDEKVRRADFAFVNDGTLAELDAFVGSVVERLTSS